MKSIALSVIGNKINVRSPVFQTQQDAASLNSTKQGVHQYQVVVLNEAHCYARCLPHLAMKELMGITCIDIAVSKLLSSVYLKCQLQDFMENHSATQKLRFSIAFSTFNFLTIHCQLTFNGEN